MSLSMAQIRSVDAKWAGHGAARPGWVGYLPYPAERFAQLIAAAAPFAAPRTFIDLGAGVGTKMLIAHAAGLDVFGVDEDAELIEAAHQLGMPVFRHDVRTAPVAGYGVVYINHPLAGAQSEAALEQRVRAQLSPGAILISVHSQLPPPAGAHWETLLPASDHDMVVRKHA